MIADSRPVLAAAAKLGIALGIALGSLTINVLTILGIGIFLSQTAWAMSLLRIAGAAYLLYLAYGAFRKAIQPPVLQPMKPNHGVPLKHFTSGYLLQITNPKCKVAAYSRTIDATTVH
ncbi:LysE family transporter [Granulosicoccus sp.]|nr:LysE family transporter [Granulosicoccus sp.]MDB4223651.1 LysE family transporter [Granulosicoccus sp.]